MGEETAMEHLRADGDIGARMGMAVCQTQEDYILGT